MLISRFPPDPEYLDVTISPVRNIPKSKANEGVRAKTGYVGPWTVIVVERYIVVGGILSTAESGADRFILLESED